MDKETLDILKEFSFELLKNNIESHYKTGSQVVRSVTPNDYDYVVYESPDYGKPLEQWLKSKKFFEDRGENYSGENLEGSDFCSYRREKLNVIYTNDRKFYEKYVSATLMVEKKQPESKEDRIAVFDAVMNGKDSERFKNIMSRKDMFEVEDPEPLLIHSGAARTYKFIPITATGYHPYTGSTTLGSPTVSTSGSKLDPKTLSSLLEDLEDVKKYFKENIKSDPKRS